MSRGRKKPSLNPAPLGSITPAYPRSKPLGIFSCTSALEAARLFGTSFWPAPRSLVYFHQENPLLARFALRGLSCLYKALGHPSSQDNREVINWHVLHSEDRFDPTRPWDPALDFSEQPRRHLLRLPPDFEPEAHLWVSDEDWKKIHPERP